MLVWAGVLSAVGLTAALSARIPLSVDGEVYLFQARLLAEGRLGTEPMPYPGFFHYYFVVAGEGGSLYGAFPPGWPAVLAAGVWFGAAWLIAPLLTGLLVWLSATLARELLPEVRGVGALTAWLLVLSPFVGRHGSIFMSHILAANLTVAALLLAFRARRGGWASALLTGLMVGALFTVRPLNAIVVGIVVAAIGLARPPRVPLARMAVAAALAAAPASLYLLVNSAVSGGPLTPGQDTYFSRTEPNARCHRLGFGPDVGCANAHHLEHPGFTIGDAAHVTGERLTELGRKGLGPGVALLLPLVLLWRRATSTTIALAALMLLQLAAYGLFYYHGNFLGPRLLFEAFVPLVVLVAAGALKLGWPGVAIAFAGLLGGHQLAEVEAEHMRWLPYEKTSALIADAQGGKKLIFVDNRGLTERWRWTNYSLGMVLGDPPGEHANLMFAHDLGASADATLTTQYPDHTPYLLRLTPGDSALDLEPSLIALPRRPRRSRVIALSGRFPLSGRRDCGFAGPAQLASGTQVLRINAKSDCTFDLGPGPASAGRWHVTIVAATAPEPGTWQLQLGDHTLTSHVLLSGRNGRIKRIPLGLTAGDASAPIRLTGAGRADLLELHFRPAD